MTNAIWPVGFVAYLGACATSSPFQFPFLLNWPKAYSTSCSSVSKYLKLSFSFPSWVISGISLVAASPSLPFRRHHGICSWKNRNNHHLPEKSQRSSKGLYRGIALRRDVALCCLFSMASRSHKFHYEAAKMVNVDHDSSLMCLRRCSGLNEHSC